VYGTPGLKNELEAGTVYKILELVANVAEKPASKRSLEATTLRASSIRKVELGGIAQHSLVLKLLKRTPQDSEGHVLRPDPRKEPLGKNKAVLTEKPNAKPARDQRRLGALKLSRGLQA
jgi:hypothetical protein